MHFMWSLLLCRNNICSLAISYLPSSYLFFLIIQFILFFRIEKHIENANSSAIHQATKRESKPFPQTVYISTYTGQW